MNVVTISTIELVELINKMRLAAGNTTKIRHDALVAKVRHMYGDNGEKYYGDHVDSTGRTWRCYNLPEQEAVALTKSYKTGISEVVRAKIADWTVNGKSKNSLLGKIVVSEVPVDNDTTMTSLELVSYINTVRAQEGDFTELTHDNFLKKVQRVLGDAAGNFNASYLNSQNKEQPMYRFPKREATLMAMSYSRTISAQVYDRMEALEKQAVAVVNTPVTLREALLLALEQQEKIEQKALSQ